jgi:type IV pilus assembly protein PilB
MVVAQRLLKKICKGCIVDHHVPPEALIELGVPESELGEYNSLKKGEGCSACNYTGMSGRMAVYEVLWISANVKDSIFKSDSPLNIKRRAMKDDGMLTLRMSALLKLKKGLTTVEEVLNSTVGDDV